MFDNNLDYFEIILIPLLLAVLGIIIANSISLFKEWKRNGDEIKTVRLLLFSDFNRINDLIFNVYEEIHKIKSNNAIRSVVINRLLSDPEMVLGILQQYYIPLKFSFWNTLSSSGLLIKLKPHEIKIVQALYNYVVKMDTSLENERFFLNKEIIKIIQNEDQNSDEKKKQLEELLRVSIFELEGVYLKMNRDLTNNLIDE